MNLKFNYSYIASYLLYLYSYYLYIDDNSAVFRTTSHDQVDKLMTFEDLEVEFAITTNKIKQVLCSSSVNVASVVEQLQTISVVRNKNIPLLDEDVFETVTTVEKLWQKLSRFWWVFDYDMLRILLKIVNCKRANKYLKSSCQKLMLLRWRIWSLFFLVKYLRGKG